VSAVPFYSHAALQVGDEAGEPDDDLAPSRTVQSARKGFLYHHPFIPAFGINKNTDSVWAHLLRQDAFKPSASVLFTLSGMASVDGATLGSLMHARRVIWLLQLRNSDDAATFVALATAAEALGII
jgi:hypothetical protein